MSCIMHKCLPAVKRDGLQKHINISELSANHESQKKVTAILSCQTPSKEHQKNTDP